MIVELGMVTDVTQDTDTGMDLDFSHIREP
jgi:hypothetical protein